MHLTISSSGGGCCCLRFVQNCPLLLQHFLRKGQPLFSLGPAICIVLRDGREGGFGSFQVSFGL